MFPSNTHCLALPFKDNGYQRFLSCPISQGQPQTRQILKNEFFPPIKVLIISRQNLTWTEINLHSNVSQKNMWCWRTMCTHKWVLSQTLSVVECEQFGLKICLFVVFYFWKLATVVHFFPRNSSWKVHAKINNIRVCLLSSLRVQDCLCAPFPQEYPF